MRLRTPLDVAEAIPYLFGYHPSESLIVIGLRGGRVGLSMRLDLTSDFVLVVDSVIEYLRPEWPEQVLLGFFGGLDINTPLLSERLRARLAYEEIGVREVVLVRDGRCYSLLCADRRCCPVEGWEMPTADPLLASTMAAALGTEVPLASRAKLVATFAEVTGDEALDMEDAIDVQANDIAAMLAACSCIAERDVLRDRYRFEAIPRVEAAVARWADSTSGSLLSDAEAAWLIVAFLDVHLRDRVVAHALAAPSLEPYEVLFTELSRRAVGDWAPPLLATAALFAWQRGSGTRARIAVERALSIDPDYRLAQLLEQALDNAMPPRMWAAQLQREA